jgi:APA family basic amino acid/polyamine antiporter
MNQQQDAAPDKELRADLGLVSALSLVIGMVLGAGAFMKPPAVLAAAGDTSWALAAWAIGGLFSITGGLTLCELGVLFPQTGGIFIYLEKLYGSKIAFLYGWMLSLIFGPATIGALTGYFSSVFCLLFNIPEYYAGVVGAAVLAFITFINSMGVKKAGYLQTLATFCKLIPIIALSVFGLWKGTGHVALWSHGGNAGATGAPAFSIAILATLFAYDGWAQVASVAGEIKNPSKILPKAIIGGLIFLITVYMAINIALFKIIPPAQIVALGHDASSIAAQNMFGLFGGNLIAVGIMISILGGINGYVMTLSRSIYVLGTRDQIFGASLWSKIDSDSKAPVNAMLMLVVCSFVYYRLLDADKLSDIAIFAIWIFYLLAFIGVFIARKTYSNAPRTYKVPLYPVVPLIAICGAVYVIYGMLSNQPLNGVVSIALTLAGLPVYYYKRGGCTLSFFPKLKTKHMIGLSSLLILSALYLSVHIFDSRPQIRVGVEPSFAPFAFEDHDGKLSGFDIDLMNAAAAKAGVKVVYQPTSLMHMIDAVRNGQVDAAICALSVTPERQKSVEFTKPYIERGGLALLVRNGSPIKSVNDLRGKVIGVQKDSTGESFCRTLGPVTTQAFRSDKDMMNALNLKQLDAVIYDRLILQHLVAENATTDDITQTLNREKYAIAFAKNNKTLGDKLNKALDEMRKDGELNALYLKWFGTDVNI